MQFEWDKEKAERNFRKHGVGFGEASTVFGDIFAKIFMDDEHSVEENREIIIGYSDTNRLLIVFFTERGDKRIRIISAREPDAIERKEYEERGKF